MRCVSFAARCVVFSTSFVATIIPAPGQTTHAPSAAQALLLRQLTAAAIERTHHSIRHDPSYVRIPYSGGDVPANTRVCTREVIRSYGAVGIDLQKEVHEDMVRNFDAYPHRGRWILSWRDPNIDHRRVPNLMVFFAHKGETLPNTNRGEDYSPGDLVTWDLGGCAL